MAANYDDPAVQKKVEGALDDAKSKPPPRGAAGASLFLVPAENYAEIKDTRNIHVVPVASFNQAVHAVASAAIPQ